MISLLAARHLLGDELTPDAIDRFLRLTKDPLAELTTKRTELAEDWSISQLPTRDVGELRPYMTQDSSTIGGDGFLNKIWAQLLYSHSLAVEDFLSGASTFSPDVASRDEASNILHSLAVLAPLIDREVVVGIPTDLLPRVKLDFGRFEKRLTGVAASVINQVRSKDSSGFKDFSGDRDTICNSLEFLASTQWSVQLEPWSYVSGYAVLALMFEGMRKEWVRRLRRGLVPDFDRRALNVLASLPVPDLSGLTAHDVVAIRDGDGFGAWRQELGEIVGRYEHDVGVRSPFAAQHAVERLHRRSADLDEEISASTALSALRGGLRTFAISGSVILAAFPVLSVSGRQEALAIAAGTSLSDLGRGLVFCYNKREERAMKATLKANVDAAQRVFESRRSTSDHQPEEVRNP